MNAKPAKPYHRTPPPQVGASCVCLRGLYGFEYIFFSIFIYALLISLKFEYQYIDILVKG